MRSSEFDTMLLCNGEAVALNWYDCAGSVGQHLRRNGSTADVETELAALRRVLDGALDPDADLATQCWSLLRLFPSGDYNLVYDQASKDLNAVEFATSQWIIDGFYAGPAEAWVVTQAELSLNRAMIDRHRARIEAGERPVVVLVTTKQSIASYVVDGHHKLRAYLETKVRPWYLEIVAVNPRLVTLQDGAAMLKGSELIGHYKQ